jgi:hypothetical protein
LDVRGELGVLEKEERGEKRGEPGLHAAVIDGGAFSLQWPFGVAEGCCSKKQCEDERVPTQERRGEERGREGHADQKK